MRINPPDTNVLLVRARVATSLTDLMQLTKY